LPNAGSRWRAARYAALALWLVLVIRLMVADVWDETNGMLAFGSASAMKTLGQKLAFALTQSVGFWRPLPTAFAAFVLHFVTNFAVAFRLMRCVNIALLLTAVALLLRALDTWAGRDERTRLIVTVAVLFSGSGIIVAGWFANIFDATALALLALGLLLQARGKHLEAGVVYGVAFFCKETTALILPFLVVLLAAGRIRFRDALRAGIPATLLGIIYFALRHKIVGPLGNPGDTHPFDPHVYGATVLGVLDTFWRQTLKANGPGVVGFLWTALSVAVLRRPRLIAAWLLFLVGVSVIYWGMLNQYQHGILISHVNFNGRLYCIPVALAIFLLAIEHHRNALAILLIPIILGAAATYRDHLHFQRVYKRIYRTARGAQVKPLKVLLPTDPTKDLDDPVRGIRIGILPDANIRIEPRNGTIDYRGPWPNPQIVR
jgi:hypothetical protein